MRRPCSCSSAARWHGVGHDLLLEPDELRRARQLECDRHARDGVDVRAALLAGEDRGVDLGGQLLVGGQDARAARAVERLVRGEADDVRVADRAGHDPRGDHPGDVRDVGQQIGAHRVGDLAEARPVGHPGVRGEAGDDHLGLVLPGQRLDLVVVQPLGDGVDAVGDDLVQLAGAVDRAAVRQVAAVQQAHAHHHVARLHQRIVDRAVGRRAGERLDVGPDLLGRDAVGGKRLGRAAAGQRFHDVGVLDALVVALGRSCGGRSPVGLRSPGSALPSALCMAGSG